MDTTTLFRAVITVIALIVLINSFITVLATVLVMVSAVNLLRYASKNDILLDRMIILVEQIGREVEYSRRMRGG